MRDRAPLLRTFLPHLKFLDGDNRGYVLIDLTPKRIQADWYHVPTVLEHTDAETRAASFVCEGVIAARERVTTCHESKLPRPMFLRVFVCLRWPVLLIA